MNRWLVAGTVVVIALLALLWIQIRTPAAAPAAVVAKKVDAAPVAQPAVAGLAAVAQKVAAAEDKPQKLDPASDAFFYKFDEQVPPMLTAEAAKCYTGGLRSVHR